jgi:hypothetical protein
MTDIEKILIGLEGCTIDGTCDGCPYYGQCNGMIYKPRERLIHDAIELIKNQKKEIEKLEHDLAVAQDNLNYYLNGNG